jgi:hypothetical protein
MGCWKGAYSLIISVCPPAPYKKKSSEVKNKGSQGIAPTRDLTCFLKILFLVAGGWFYSNYILQGYKTDKEWKILRKKLSFMYTKSFNIYFFLNGFNPMWV